MAKQKKKRPVLNRKIVLLSDEEVTQIEERATRKGLPVSSYIRDRLELPVAVLGRPKKARAK